MIADGRAKIEEDLRLCTYFGDRFPRMRWFCASFFFSFGAVAGQPLSHPSTPRPNSSKKRKKKKGINQARNHHLLDRRCAKIIRKTQKRPDALRPSNGRFQTKNSQPLYRYPFTGFRIFQNTGGRPVTLTRS